MSALTALLMIVAVAGAFLAVTLKNILHAIFGLALTLLALAGLFFVLNSPFVAAMEVLIYVGGISVAMVFAVMLSTVSPQHRPETALRRGAALLVALAFGVSVGAVVVTSGLGDVTAPAIVDADWSVAAIGRALLDDYNVIFEALSLVLLLAIIGAIVITRRERDDAPDAPAPIGAPTPLRPETDPEAS